VIFEETTKYLRIVSCGGILFIKWQMREKLSCENCSWGNEEDRVM